MKVRTEELVKLIAGDNAEYMRLRRRVIGLSESERSLIEREVNATLDDIKRRISQNR